MLFNVSLSLSLSISFLVGAFLWVGLIVYILCAGTMLFNVSLSLSVSFLVGAFLWVGLIGKEVHLSVGQSIAG